MRLFDVNVLVYAHRADANHHEACRSFLDDTIADPASFGLSPLALSGFLRIVTHPRIFKTPTPLPDALDFVVALRGQPQAIVTEPGPRHWDLFTSLSADVAARGNLIPDAYFAAIAIESGSEWVTTDGDFARFPRLRWIDPRAA